MDFVHDSVLLVLNLGLSWFPSARQSIRTLGVAFISDKRVSCRKDFHLNSRSEPQILKSNILLNVTTCGLI
jgi:hypothetical protein